MKDMRYRIFCFFFILLFNVNVLAQDVYKIPGLVFGLRHTDNQKNDEIRSLPLPQSELTPIFGGDIKARMNGGFHWWMIKDRPYDRLNLDQNRIEEIIPPGVVFALKHSQNNSDKIITTFGLDPVNNRVTKLGLFAMNGGDLGAPNNAGFYWYEGTGQAFRDWSIVDRLPKFTVVGLKHSINQKNNTFRWKGQFYDPAQSSGRTMLVCPNGFSHKFGGDFGAPARHGYHWCEKAY